MPSSRDVSGINMPRTKMDDVIVIEDTPPSSPVKTIKNLPKHRAIAPKVSQMYYQPYNHEFPVAEQAMIWSQNTTNFIKQSMTSIQNNRMPLMTNMQKPVQIGTFIPRNRYPYNSSNTFPRPPYTINNFNPYMNSYYPMNSFRPIGNSNYLNNMYNPNFWMKVKLEELPDKGEIVSQYYIDNNQTPVKINRSQNEPEFIDIADLANKNSQTNEILQVSTEIDDKKRKNSVPPFLKRNRPTNKMKIPEGISSNNNKEDEDDIIFLGEFKRDVYPEISIIPITKGSKISISSEDSTKEENGKQTKHVFKFGQKKRKDKSIMPLRRNPKRKVQIEKDFLKMIDDVLMESEKEEKQKKSAGFKKKLGRPPIKHYRRTSRNLDNSGAIYNPPSPLTEAHIRLWPSEGMHERPEYDPSTGKIYPFDSHIRNISENFTPNSTISHKKDFYIEDNNQTLPEVCHEVLHHVMAYVASVKKLEKIDQQTNDKNKFLESFNLITNDNIENKICDILHSVVDDIENNKSEDNNDSLKELLTNSILLYCLSNNVEQKEVAKYIATVKPEDIIKLSYEKFGLHC